MVSHQDGGHRGRERCGPTWMWGEKKERKLRWPPGLCLERQLRPRTNFSTPLSSTSLTWTTGTSEASGHVHPQQGGLLTGGQLKGQANPPLGLSFLLPHLAGEVGEKHGFWSTH